MLFSGINDHRWRVDRKKVGGVPYPTHREQLKKLHTKYSKTCSQRKPANNEHSVGNTEHKKKS
jgi:hypothetical protein